MQAGVYNEILSFKP